LIKNFQPFGKNVRKPQGGIFKNIARIFSSVHVQDNTTSEFCSMCFAKASCDYLGLRLAAMEEALAASEAECHQMAHDTFLVHLEHSTLS